MNIASNIKTQELVEAEGGITAVIGTLMLQDSKLLKDLKAWTEIFIYSCCALTKFAENNPANISVITTALGSMHFLFAAMKTELKKSALGQVHRHPTILNN